MVRRKVLCALSLLAAAASPPSALAADDHGEEARWLVSTSKWATLSWLEGGDDLQSLAMSVASNDEGRIFMYLLEDLTFKASLTFSEAQLDPDQFFGARCGPDGALDPQDPRCAKLTVSGVVSPVPEEDKQLALDALFAAHPQMKDWPADHHFVVCEMKPHEDGGIWMISGFGGGGFTDAKTYYASSPVRHAQQGFTGFGGDRRRALAAGRELGVLGGEGRELSAACYNPQSHACECQDEKCGDDKCGAAGGIWTTECNAECSCDSSGSQPSVGEGHGHGDGHGHGGGMGGGHGHGDGNGGGHHGHGDGHHGHGDGAGGAPEAEPSERDISFALLPRPDFGSDAAGHARWIVSKSLWTSLSTISSTDAEQPFGNIRSIVDGMCLMASTGLPIFYLPTPDPSSVDIRANPKVSLSFTESALAETLGADGLPCGGRDAEDPTCAKLSLIGKAVPIEDDAVEEAAMAAFGANHPRAEWLSAGGSHTGGGYYTLELEKIMFLRNFGGFAHVSPDEYLKWKPEGSDLPGEAACAGAVTSDASQGMAQQSVATTQPSSSSIGFGALFMIMLVSFAGSFAGGVLKDRLMGTWHSRRNVGYSKANNAESPQELTPAVV